MANGVYTGIGDVAKKVKKIYVGVGNVAKEVKKIYVGENGVAKLAYSPGKKWVPKTWNSEVQQFLDGQYIWTDGINIFYSRSLDQYVLNKSSGIWEPKTWSGIYGSSQSQQVPWSDWIWTDGTDIYYSPDANNNYILKDGDAGIWEYKWISNTPFSSNFTAKEVWTDGTHTFFSNGNTTHKLFDKTNSQWNNTGFSGTNRAFYGRNVWTDGTDIYCSNGTSYHFIFNKSTGIWEPKTWYGLTEFNGIYIWTDGTDIYYSSLGASTTYILNKASSTWSEIDLGTAISGSSVWTDGINTYWSVGRGIHYQLV